MRTGGLRGDTRAGTRDTLIVVIAAATAITAELGLVTLTTPTIAGLVALVLVIVGVSSAVEIVDPYERKALTVLGEYRGLLEPGLNWVPPFVSAAHSYDLRTHLIDVPHQEAITRDNSPVEANAVVYVRVTDAERAFLEVEDYERAVGNLAQTTLRAVLGDMELDETLSKRREINEQIRRDLAAPTDEWGVRIMSVEVEEITPSAGVLDAMEEQTGAERRRRAMILEAQGERRSAVERAQGEKQANIVRAQGKKQSQILEAQGDAVSTVLRARAADAMGERAVIDRGMETLASIGQAPSTTYVLPQELSSTLGRYGKHLTGGDVATGEPLEGRAFGAAERELLGLDDIDKLAEGIEIGDGDSAPAEAADGATRGDGDLAPGGAVREGVEAATGDASDAVEDTTDAVRSAVEDPADEESSGAGETIADEESSGAGS